MKKAKPGSSNRWRKGLKTQLLVIAVSLMTVAVLLGIAGCSSVSQKEYDSVKSELTDANQQIDALQAQLDEVTVKGLQYDLLNDQYQDLSTQYEAQTGEMETLQDDIDALNTSYEQLKKQDDARLDEIQAVQDEYDSLDQEYRTLKQQYDSFVQGQTNFTDEEVDQALFDLINEDRRANGLEDLQWGKNLYGWAIINSRAMAQSGDFRNSDWGGTWQGLAITAGQDTLDGLVNGVLTVWQQQKYEYPRSFLNPKSPYAAVATFKSNGAYFITYLASTYE